MKLLYCRKALDDLRDDSASEDINCGVFTPRIFGGLFLPGEVRSPKLWLLRASFRIMSLGKAKIFFVQGEHSPAHTSYVIPKCSKFPFLGKDDYEIGPCLTYPQYRGKGIYPGVLRWICKNVGNENTTFYMIVDQANTPSIKGIEKAGFKKRGTVKVAGLTKRYIALKD